MSQFGKNPPWARDVGPMNQAAGLTLNSPQLGLVPQVYGQAAVATPTMFSIQPGIALPTTLASSHVATVTYPSPRPAPASALQHKQRVFTGTVTKLHENFGFVDEDVFFQTSCVNGQQPKLGDRVLVEATYNASMPFKWNATRIQVLTTLVQSGNPAPASQGFSAVIAQPSYSGVSAVSQGGSAFHAVAYKPVSVGSSSISNILQQPPLLMSRQTQPIHSRGSNLGSGTRRMEAASFKDRSDRVRERDCSRERRDRRSPRKRSRSPHRSRSPRRSRSPQRSPLSSKSPRRSRSPRSPSSRAKSPQRTRRPVRAASRYTVQVPKISLDLKDANLMTVRSRYTNMYIPSDFYSAAFLWADVFPMHRPFPLGSSSQFHIFPKTVTPPPRPDCCVDPSDADYRFSVKVMLLACPTLEDLYRKSCALAQDTPEIRELSQHPTRLIQFLVGLKGKGEPMAVGGPWSPSLDGVDPEENPRVLINTAIRTTKALTGIDLGRCTQWFRFTEIRYYRPEEVRKGRTVPAHAETVVIFLPDVWTCRPTHLEWQTLLAEYRTLLDAKLSSEEFRLEPKEEEIEAEKEVGSDKKDPTHHSDLDPKTMKLTDLREELECRTLSSKGLKSQLIARLTKALRSEEEREAEELERKCNEEDENKEDDDAGKMDVEEDDKQRLKEKERAALVSQYTLPNSPSVLVHPSPTAKGGKFECTVMSLSLLLDYRPEDNKEHVFEVSLFAEMFNEMLMRDFGFRIYKHLASAPENTEDDKRDKDDRRYKAKSKSGDKRGCGKINDNGTSDEALPTDAGDCEKGEQIGDGKRIKMEEDKVGISAQNAEAEQGVSGVDGKIESDSCNDQLKDNSEDSKDEKEKKSVRSFAKHDRVRLVTALPDLLLAFIYFDQSRAGYLVDRDVEEILFTLGGLQLSRAQVKKLVSKFASKDIVNYRKLTDVAPNEKRRVTDIACANVSAITDEDNRLLALGNRHLLVECAPRASLVTSQKRSLLGSEGESSEGPAIEGVVLHNGALIDVCSVMLNLAKSEESRIKTETELKELQQKLDETRANCGSRDLANRTMTSELTDLKKRLEEQSHLLERAESNAKRYHDLLLRTRSTLSALEYDIEETVSKNTGKADESKPADA